MKYQQNHTFHGWKPMRIFIPSSDNKLRTDTGSGLGEVS